MSAYYNEHDPQAAAWLRELIKQGHIAPGEVDERSIEDVTPDELARYTQCHFFAGIGVWSHALRNAGWDDSRPIWTGSCPCQPFSAAGKGAGFADERHLWPAFHWLIKQCRPGVVFGEQVAGKNGMSWLDLVSTDLEGEGYACGASVTPACGFGAPHMRQRLYWVADTDSERHHGLDALLRKGSGRERRAQEMLEATRGGEAGSVADTSGQGLSPRQCPELPATHGQHQGRAVEQCGSALDQGLPSPTNGHWRDADWLGCTDGKWRPVESGTFPLADGASARVGRLRGYGNAIVAPQAQAFIESYLAHTNNGEHHDTK